MWQCKVYLILSLVLPLAVWSQRVPDRITIPQYVERYKDIAVRKMMDHGIPASITLAQGILESASGNSDLAIQANNHFGIKCHKEWTGETFLRDDDEKDECFRKYQYPEQSFEDHSRFLKTRSRYAFLFEYDPTDFRSWAYGLKKAGYATNPDYPDLLIRIIEENGLARYDYMQSLTLPATDLAIGRINGVRHTWARKGDDLPRLAKDLEMMNWQLIRYNELDKHARISEGEVIYLQPKRRKASTAYHLVKEGETMHSISQQYGIKMKHLYRKNRMQPGTEPEAGRRLWLRHKKPAD